MSEIASTTLRNDRPSSHLLGESCGGFRCSAPVPSHRHVCWLDDGAQRGDD